MNAQKPAVALLGTMDTKGREFGFVRDQIEADGVSVVVIDLGIVGEPLIAPDISTDEVARSVGSSLEELRRGEKADALGKISEGAVVVLRGLYDEGRIHGALALGGGQGTTITAAALRALPLGVPKQLVSVLASLPNAAAGLYGTRDLSITNPVIDISGLNSVSREILANAADSIAGAAKGHFARKAQAAAHADKRPFRVSTTMFGVTTKGVTAAAALLEQAGLDVLVFAATGVGDRAMEELVEDGVIDGVLDITISRVGEAVVRDGQSSAGPRRLEVAGAAGLPQVIAPGGLDILFPRRPPAVDPVWEEAVAGKRKSFAHNPMLTVVRPTVEESGRIGEEVARKLNTARGPVVVVWPRKGLSDYSAEGGALHDPEADRAMLDGLKRTINPSIPVVEVDAMINDPEFIQELVSQFLKLVPAARLVGPVS